MNSAHPSTQLASETRALATRHGLHLTGDIVFNEMGLDFRVGFATDASGRRWVLRIPRSGSMQARIDHEARILDFVKHRLPIEVPDWRLRGPDLVAYPMLADPMALVFDAETHAVTWNMDQGSDRYVESLAEVLVALHSLLTAEAVAAGVPESTPAEARAKLEGELEYVKREIGIGWELEARCRRWLDDDRLWPDFCVFTHGDLYAGHITVSADARVSGVIDWSEAEIGDASVDFSGHLAAFSPQSLEHLVAAYERVGGRTWPGMVEHIKQRYAASPIKYGAFAIRTGDEQHLAAARAQLHAGQ